MGKKTIFLTVLVFTVISFAVGYYFKDVITGYFSSDINITKTTNTPTPKPLDKYQFENLKVSPPQEGTFTVGNVIDDKNPKYISRLFKFAFNPSLDPKETKQTTGMVNFPTSQETNEKFPVVIMIRGYVDQKIYTTGTGTIHAAQVFAENGYITVAPDFLGYAGSDTEASNIFESRFQTYVTVLSLLKSISQIPNWDGKNIFIWGHSNGGQIALTVLEITGDNIPTTLWAPVSKPFPYSILYYTDESDDHGKLIRSELAKFEDNYDVEKYSLTNYLEGIQAKLQIHQGTADDAVPYGWTDVLYKNLKKLNKDVTLYSYPGADHNLQPVWNTVVSRDLKYFDDNIK